MFSFDSRNFVETNIRNYFGDKKIFLRLNLRDFVGGEVGGSSDFVDCHLAKRFEGTGNKQFRLFFAYHQTFRTTFRTSFFFAVRKTKPIFPVHHVFPYDFSVYLTDITILFSRVFCGWLFICFFRKHKDIAAGGNPAPLQAAGLLPPQYLCVSVSVFSVSTTDSITWLIAAPNRANRPSVSLDVVDLGVHAVRT